MNSIDFKTNGTDMINYITTYMDTLPFRRVTPIVEPGYMRKLLQEYAPKQGESFKDILKDVDEVIMPGVTHWQHPRFHAYFPAGNSYPSILADMLSDAIGCMGFSWEDRRMGLIPFYVCATLGTTGCCSFDNISELGEVCAKENVWLHIDAAYAGSAFICPEFQYLLKGIEHVNSINFNPNKWLLVNFDCSLLWVRDKTVLISALAVDAVYLQHEHGGYGIDVLVDMYRYLRNEFDFWNVHGTINTSGLLQKLDFRHWGIPLSRRFRSLKLWFVLRSYGVDGLQEYIRKHIRLAKLFETYVQMDNQFEVLGKVTMGLVCFRLKGPNALTQKLLKMIDESGELHMVPALVNENYVIRFAICAENADEMDIYYAWRVIAGMAGKLTTSFEHMDKNELSESGDEEFEEFFDRKLVFDQQRNTLRRACEKRNLFHRMVSDPKGFNKTLLRALSIDDRQKIRSESDVKDSKSADDKPKKSTLST